MCHPYSAAARGLWHNHTYMSRGESDSDLAVQNDGDGDDDAPPLHPYSYKNKLKRMLDKLKRSQEAEAAGASSATLIAWTPAA